MLEKKDKGDGTSCHEALQSETEGCFNSVGLKAKLKLLEREHPPPPIDDEIQESEAMPDLILDRPLPILFFSEENYPKAIQ